MYDNTEYLYWSFLDPLALFTWQCLTICVYSIVQVDKSFHVKCELHNCILLEKQWQSVITFSGVSKTRVGQF